MLGLIIQFQLSQQDNQQMYRRALRLSSFGVTAMAKHQAQKARNELIKLFQCKDTKRELSTHLKILPDYFSSDLVDQFCNSHLHDQFCDNELEFQEDQRKELTLQKYFTTPRLLRAINTNHSLQCLETYIHWLMNDCETFNIHENNYALELLNLDRPDKWFQIKDYCQKRTFIYHHGPTNSGKSTAAVEDLRSLKGNQRGIYMAPLRLLAWEYQQKLENCSLVTGQEKQYKNSSLISCTIEAAPLNDTYEVAVIDEIQMIGDAERGWAWTRAVLAVKAKRVHLCGDQRALNIIGKLLELTGDNLEQRRYSRLSKLKLIHRKFKLENISPGDCIINFSMNSLINHRNDINKFINSKNEKNQQLEVEDKQNSFQQKGEQSETIHQISQANQQIYDSKGKTNHSAIIYGRLPPECRKSQALMFNTRDLPYLVATNAIGMGLNLNIRKIVFLAIERPTNFGHEELEQHEIQQIAGRAGRGKQTGYVQCSNEFVLKKVEKALSKVNQTYGIQLENIKDDSNELQHALDEDQNEEDKVAQTYSIHLKRYLKQKQCKIKAACFYFQTDYIILFKLQLQKVIGKTMSNIEVLNYLHSYCKISDFYFMQEAKSMNYIMNLLQNQKMDQEELFLFYNGLNLSVPNVTTPKRIREKMENCHKKYIEQFVNLRKVDLLPLIVRLHQENFQSFRYMDQIAQLQFYFNLLETYVWLWAKFQFAFHEIKLAKEIKLALSQKINEVLLDNQFITEKRSGNSFRLAQKMHSKTPHKSYRPIFKQKKQRIISTPVKTQIRIQADSQQKKDKTKGFFKKAKSILQAQQKIEVKVQAKHSIVYKARRQTNKKKMNKNIFKFKISKLKNYFKNKLKSKTIKKIIKNWRRIFPKEVKTVFKFSHRKKKAVKLEVIV